MNKHLHRILYILIFISVAAATYLYIKPSQIQLDQLPRTTTILQTPIPALLKNNAHKDTLVIQKSKTAYTIDKAAPPASSTDSNLPTTLSPTSTSLEESSPETIPVTLTVSDTSHQIQVLPNSTAYQVMNQLKQENKLSFSTKNFSGLGYFIEEINGIKNSPSTGFYWTLYINNQEAKVGISNYTVKPNDTLTWKFENK